MTLKLLMSLAFVRSSGGSTEPYHFFFVDSISLSMVGSEGDEQIAVVFRHLNIAIAFVFLFLILLRHGFYQVPAKQQ